MSMLGKWRASQCTAWQIVLILFRSTVRIQLHYKRYVNFPKFRCTQKKILIMIKNAQAAQFFNELTQPTIGFWQ